jgi:hypothetical protein
MSALGPPPPRRAWLLAAALLAAGCGLVEAGPGIHVSLDAIPRRESRVLVAPPGGFHLTIRFEMRDAVPIDITTLSVRADRAIAGEPAGSELAGHFQVDGAGVVWRVPPDPDIERTTHRIEASVRDMQGRASRDEFAFAVRDFPVGAPFAERQRILLDFRRHREGAPPDFVLSLRRLGLTSARAPWLERALRLRIQQAILRRVRQLYGRQQDGRRGPDPVNVEFSLHAPWATGRWSRLCVGGMHPDDPTALGSVPLDLDNLEERRDECADRSHGVFPDAIESLWGNDPLFVSTFGPLAPGHGGTPVGTHPLDRDLFTPGVMRRVDSDAGARRFSQVAAAQELFVQIIAVATAHEIGHLFGLTAPGPAPAGLFGGSTAALSGHNVDADGAPLEGPFIMNRGGSFTLESISGREGPLRFRPINHAYLRDRIVRHDGIDALHPPPSLARVEPLHIATSEGTTTLTLHGERFRAPLAVELVGERGGRVYTLAVPARASPQRASATLDPHLVPPGRYRVRLLTGDAQQALFDGAVEIARGG